MKKLYTLILFMCLVVLANAQGSLSAAGPAGAVAINFDGSTAGILNGTFGGLQISATPAAGELDMNGVYIRDNISGTGEDQNIAFGAGGTSASFASMQGASAGSVTSSGIYAFNTGTSVALGFQGSGSRWGDGSGDDGHIIFRFQNNSGVTLDNFTVGYDIYQYNDQGRSTQIEAFLTTDVATPTFGAVLNSYSSPETADAAPAWSLVSSPNFSSNISVPNGGFIYLRFLIQDGTPSGSGSRDEMALDNITIYGTAAIPAPVDMSPVSATLLENDVRIDWTTYTEKNNAGFEIQRGTDGVHFKTIGFERGQLESNLTLDYSYRDATAVNGINYYRIKQVDIDEKYTFSNIAQVDVTKAGNFKANIYPNPITNQTVNIELESSIKDVAKVEIYSLNGQLVLSTHWSIIKGINQLPITTNLLAGHYILSIQANNIAQQELIVVTQ